MTIFLHLAKEYLHRIIMIDYDASLTGWNIPFSKPSLSVEDRTKITFNIIPAIVNFSPEEINDENALKAFSRILTTYSDKNPTLFALLNKALRALDTLFETVKTSKALNVPYDEDPYHIFLYFIVNYRVERAMEPFMPASFLKNRTQSKELVQEKDVLILKALDRCIKALADSKSSETPEGKKALVRDQISILLKENYEACRKYDPKLSVIVAELTITALSRGEGFLCECMREALEKIDKGSPATMKNTQNSPSTSRGSLFHSNQSSNQSSPSLPRKVTGAEGGSPAASSS